jgi:ferric-dicitrate binding protein FerR (iron transport regulator)
MSIRARRTRRRRMSRFEAYYHTAAWYARRDAVRARAKGRCEFCRWRPMQHVHHRTYASFGQEPLEHLMAVCQACHRAIHGLGRFGAALTCATGSLLHQGDSGMGSSEPWRRYLAAITGEKHERRARQRSA